MLKTNNYLDKNYNEVRSVVALAQVDTERGKAVFHIGVSREQIEKRNIIESKTLYMTFPRNVNPFEYAYQKAKEPVMGEVYNNETHTVERKLVDNIFTGWEDDISLLK